MAKRNVKRPWYYYLILQYVALCLAVSAVLTGALIATLNAQPPKPLVLHWRDATPAEERQYERDQLADFMDAMRPQG